MMKKKVTTIALAAVLAGVALVGGTMAYFQDSDVQKNTFTVGNVAIDLFEDFACDENGIAALMPATGSAQAGTLQNGVEKEVYVENTGSEPAFVRVHIAIPSILDDGDPSFNAAANVLHFNFSKASMADGKWSWGKSSDAANYPGNGGDWNSYTTTIDGVSYNVYVVTYETALKKGEVTLDAMHQVYLAADTTNEDILKIKETLGDNWMIYVAAEGVQETGFTDAYTALNTAFGVPGSYTVNFKATAENKTNVDLDATA